MTECTYQGPARRLPVLSVRWLEDTCDSRTRAPKILQKGEMLCSGEGFHASERFHSAFAFRCRSGGQRQVMATHNDDAVLYRVNAETGCWEWARYITPKGYGRYLRDGEQLAHRVFYKRYVGSIPEGAVLDHLCRNRACVNPAHLEPVSNRENIMRGEGFAARFAARTHCAEGHPLSGDNLIVSKYGRHCRACRRKNDAARQRRYRAERRAAA